MAENHLVCPLDMPSADYVHNYVQPVPPPRVKAYLSIFRLDADFPLQDDPREQQLLEGITANDTDAGRLSLYGSGPLYSYTISLSTMTMPEYKFLSDGQTGAEASWIFDNLFLDMAFFEDSDATVMDPDAAELQILSGIVAMRFLNRWHIATSSLEPTHHKPMEMTGISASGYRSVIGDVFKSGVGIWSRELAMVRTRSLVSARAILQGRDPVVEWERFCTAGGKSHFEYPVLCP